MTVTKLERQKNRKDRWSVYVDGEFVFGLDEVDMLYYKLAEGAEISEERLKYLRDQVVYAKASQKALDYLSHRPRTVKEIEKKLSEDYEQDIIMRVMDMLYEYKYADDASYAKEYTKERALAGYGPKKIEWDLRGRGIGQDLTDAALEMTGGAQKQSAMAALRARYRNKQIRDDKEKAGAFNYLLRRGFDSDTARDALSDFFNIDADLDFRVNI